MIKLLKFQGEYSAVVRKNFIINLFDGAVFAFAMGFVSLITIMPVYVKQIGGSNIEIGLIPVIWAIGFNLPQIFIANYAANQPFKKPLMMKTAFLQRLPWLMLAIVSLLITWYNLSITAGLIIFFLFFFLAALGGGINLPVWFDLFAKLTPVRIRGKQFAYRVMLGALLGILAGWVTKIILNNVDPGLSFPSLFFIAFLIMMISYTLLIKIIEEQPNHPKRILKYQEFIYNLPRILRENTNYRNFLIADAFIIIAIISNAFITVDALEKFSLSDGYAGIFTIIMMISTIVGSLFFGVLSDHIGHRFNLLLAAVFTFLACIVALTAPSVDIYYFAFVGSALANAILQVSRLPIISEICAEEDRPTYVALSNLITVPFTLAGIIGGYIANKLGYQPVFIICAVFSALAAGWLKFILVEPRKILQNI
ncbi:MAG: MFS transporter [Bacteroidetes bacterium]|nr:MFS transporter [Bacteroidota bacterium]